MTATTTDHTTTDTHLARVGVVALSDPGPATTVPAPEPGAPAGVNLSPPDTDQGGRDTHTNYVGSGGELPPRAPATADPTPKAEPPGPGNFAHLRILSESFEDAQKARIAVSNRLSSGTVDADPVADALDALTHAEQKLGLAMRREFRRTAPAVRAWVDATPGVGEHLVSRLLGTIGDPLIASPHHWEGTGADRRLVPDPPFVRNVGKLWAYCGVGDPGRRRRKGMSDTEAAGLGNPRAKMLVHLLAESAMKCAGTARSRRSPYRDVYEMARAEYEGRADWTKGHRHNAALRRVGKAMLKDLWVASHGDHETATTTDHVHTDTHLARVGVVALSDPGPARDSSTPVTPAPAGVNSEGRT